MLLANLRSQCGALSRLFQYTTLLDCSPFLRSFGTATKTEFRLMGEKLEDLPSISKISDNVVRVLGQNPSKFTLQGPSRTPPLFRFIPSDIDYNHLTGTNTYILGTQVPYVLLDTAEGKPEYPPILSSALDTLPTPLTPLPDISDIIVSHWHIDHIGGLPSVLSLLLSRWQTRNPTLPSTSYPAPRLHKFPIPQDVTGIAATKHNHLSEVVESIPQGTFTPTAEGNTFHDLRDNQLFRSSSPTIRVLHTPGHTIDSISLDIADDRALYTADTVLGQGTAVFEDLGLYLQSLNKMLEYGKNDTAGYQILYPCHGPVVKNGRELISTYIKHRLEREEQILQVLRGKPTEGGNWTIWTIVKVIYASYPENLWLPAARSIELHLLKLKRDRVVQRLGGEGVDTAWGLVSRTPSPSL
ncbi:hypothetical protein D9756_009010 [Leucocoprinus leucothites]|uniref:Metallo-beta-lactamase domain-containing protein n=1 Tax=Leucocoprinus leucothites TaxID=201217 RepID=A0A8H5FUP5_9AGAR|nr:hypothetical protein D9756_009010 [Leucoagaricus leucothites]